MSRLPHAPRFPGWLLGCALAAATPCAAAADEWAGRDKALHFGASVPLGALGAGVFAGKDASTGRRMLYGTLIGALPGAAKELADARASADGRGDASGRDMAWNVLGAAVGALLLDCCLVRPIARQDRIDGVTIEYRIDF